MKKFGLLFSIFIFTSQLSWAQSTVFTESMGTVSGTTTIATHETNNGFDNDSYTMTQGGATNPADIRATSASSGYAGASGLANVYFTSTNAEYGFAIEGIDASGYTDLILQFGYRKESGSALPTLTLDYWNGSNYINVPFTFNEAANASTGWYLSPAINLPAATQINGLRLRWVKTGTVAVRIDDVKLTRFSSDPSILVSTNTLSGFTYVQGSGPSSEQTFTISGSNLTANISIAASTNYEISQTSGSGYTTPISLTQSGGIVNSTTIYVRLKAGLSIAAYNEIIAATSTGATTQNVTVSGNVTYPVSSLPMVEDFGYVTSTPLTSNGWSSHSAQGTNPILVTGSGLTYTNYSGSGVGNAVALTTSGEDDNRLFDQQITGDVYVALMVNVSTAQTAGDYFFNLSTNPLGTFSSRLSAKDDGSGNLKFGIAKSNVATYATGNYSYNSTHLVVVKYTFNGSTTDDVVGIYIDPNIPGPEPGSFDAQGTVLEADATGIGAIALRQGTASNAPTLVVDGIRVATTWDAIPLPIELTSFSATTIGTRVKLSWNTATETNNYGFEVERASLSASPLRVWEKIGFVNGNGNSNSPKNYSFVDDKVSAGKYSYRLKQIDNDGQFEYSKIIEVDLGSPKKFELSQNYPNPFNPATTIRFNLPEAGIVKLTLYNILGQKIRTLLNEVKEAGTHTINFNASELNSGMYIYKIEAGSFTQTRKMTLVK